MRFTTWPALPTAFIIFTAALLSLIPAANAQTVPFSVLWDSPNAGDLYIAGQESKIIWYVSKMGTRKPSGGGMIDL